MGERLHCVEFERGRRFRVWTTISGCYLTEEMTEEQLLDWIFRRAVLNLLKAFDLWLRDAETIDSWQEEINRLDDVFSFRSVGFDIKRRQKEMLLRFLTSDYFKDV